MSSIRRWFDRIGLSRNTAPKIASLVLAIVLWIYVMDIENPEIIKSFDNIPISLVNVEQVESNGLLLANPTDLSVNLKLKGRRAELLKLSLTDIRVTADLYGAVKGYNSIPLNFEIDNDDVYMTNSSRNDLNLYLDKVVELPKKVDVRIVGNLPEGYSRGEIEITPEEVLVRGPEKLVNEVARLIGELDIADLKKDLLKEIPVIAVDNDGNIVQGVEVKTLYVNAGIGVFKIVELPIEIQFTGALPEGYRMIESTVNPDFLRVIGKEDDLLNNLKSVPISIDLTDHTEAFDINVPLQLPSPLKSIDLVDSIMTHVNVEQIITVSYTYDFKEISFLNLASQLVVEDQSVQIIVRVSGVESVISTMSKEDIALQVDLKDLAQGNYQMLINLKTKMEIDSIESDITELDVNLLEK